MTTDRTGGACARSGRPGIHWLAAALAALLTSLAGCGGSGSSSSQMLSVSVTPASASVQANIGTQALTASVTGASNTSVTWQVGGVSGGNATLGTISAAGLYAAPAVVPSPPAVTVTAVSVADASKSGSATLTVTPPVGVALSPAGASVAVNAAQPFTAAVTNATNTAVTWRVNGIAGGDATLGTVSASGVYVAPASIPAGSVTVSAVAAADPAQSGSATVTVVPSSGVAVTVIPRRAALTTRVAQQFVATVSGSANTSVTWVVDGVTGGSAATGTISATGFYTPPAAPGVHTLVATSVADASRSGAAAIAVTDLGGVTTQRYDQSRSGQNLSEYALTPAQVGTGGAFGKLFSCAVDGPLYAQPLWVANLAIAGGTHNVVFVATQHASIYAFDADIAPCHPYWKVSLLGVGETPVPANDTGEPFDVPGEFGVTGTPVIDLTSGTLYAVATSKNASGPAYLYRLHALALATGAARANSPALITSTINGHTLDALHHMQRPGLLLLGHTVYIAFGSHGDIPPYFGWLLGYDAASLAQVAAFNFAPHLTQAAVWMAGTAPAADASGNIYVATANGTFDADSPAAPNDDYGDSVVKLATTAGLTVSDYFTPSNQASLNSHDLDLGSTGVLLLPDALGSTAHPHLAIASDKESKVFLIDRDNMGHFTASGPDKILQTLLVNGTGNCITCGIFSSPSVSGGHLYVGAINDNVKSYSIANAAISASPTSQSGDVYGYAGTNTVISASGSSGAVLWAVDTNSNGSGTTGSNPSGPAILRAYDATNLTLRLWSSDTSAADTAGNAVKLIVPTVANGKVYLGCQAELTVYGLRP